MIKIKLVDGTTKTQLLDLSQSLDEVVIALSKKIGLKNPEEYSLLIEGKAGNFRTIFEAI